MKGTVFVILLTLFASHISAQMYTETDTLYGNEWIKPEQNYLRFAIAESGMQQIDISDLAAAGWPTASIASNQYRLYRQGEEIALYISNDKIYFLGQANDGALDRFLYEDPADQLNPAYSLISDIAYYYLTYEPIPGAAPLRFEDITAVAPATSTADYWWQEYEQVFKEKALKEYERYAGTSVYYSHLTASEGYGSRGDNQMLESGGNIQTVTVILDNLYSAGPNSRLETRFGSGFSFHQQSLSANDTAIWSGSYPAWQVQDLTLDLPALTDENLELTFQGNNSENDEVSIAYIRVQYPAQLSIPNSSSWSFRVDPTNDITAYTVDGFSGTNAVIYDLTNLRRYPAELADGQVSFRLPASPISRSLRLVAENELDQITAYQPISFPNLVQPSTDYLIITHDDFLQGGANPVQAYADYRSSLSGGGYQVQIVSIDKLYDQFAYGQQHHPLALRNFVAYLHQQNVPLRFCFIIGKGREYRDIRTPEDLAAAEGTNFIPSFGFPASDNLLFSPLGRSRPSIAIGRLPVVNQAEIDLYLDKVKTQEESRAIAAQNIAERAWRKQIIHLGGGGSPNEQQTIRNRLLQMKNIIEQNDFAGEVNSFFKTSTDPLETSQSEQIFERINAGVSIISFFGHSSAGVFDFSSIDNRDGYDNFAKYPIMLSLGCYAGNIFEGFRSVGERFIFQEDKEALAFAASRGLGFISSLGDFGSYFYQLAGSDMQNATLGELLQATIANFDGETWIGTRTLAEQFLLNGDPAIRINPNPGPDFITDVRDIRFEPSVLSIQQDSFDLSFSILNLGKAQRDSFNLRIEQELPSGQRTLWTTLRVQAEGFKTDVQLRLASPNRTAVGENRLHILLDSNNEITESPTPTAETNNQLVDANGREGLAFFVVDNTAIPIYPEEFALVGEVPELRASTADALAVSRDYVMQLDTTPDFRTPLASNQISQRGGLIRWSPDISWQADRVYYWRISPDSIAGSLGFTWETSSFTYKPGTDPGWRQGHWGQYERNDLENMRAADFQKLSFVPNIRDFRIKQKVYDQGDQPTGFVNGTRWSDFFRWNINESLQVVVIDTLGRFLFNPKPGQYGSVNTNADRIACFPFQINNTTERQEFLDFIEYTVPENYTVVVYTAIRNVNSDFFVEDWAADSLQLDGRNIFNVLEGFGAINIRELENGIRLYLFAFQKGSGDGAIGEVLAPDLNTTFNWNFPIETFWDEGNMNSRLIGPASQWDRLEWQGQLFNETDSLSIRLTAISNDGANNVLSEDLGLAGSFDLTSLSAEEYPYLRLELYAQDVELQTSPQLDYWQAFYEGRPDLALDANDYFSFRADTLQQGENARLSFSVLNVGPYPMDSTNLVARLVDASQNESNVTVAVPALAPADSIQLDLVLDTRSLRGDAQLSLSLNPADQPVERYLFNNQAIRTLVVEADIRQPVLNVTFDGLAIRDGDLVPTRPIVNIELIDENEFLLLNDTSLFRLDLRDPNGNSRRISLDGTEALFFPAEQGNDNRARIEWDPEFDITGIYELSIVGRDASGNNSGTIAYRVSFEVITERRIGNVLPYPNPFTTQTRFVYTLTGDEPPAEMKIQIMTSSGRIVREILQSELGPLRIGTHQTDFAWDGTDQFGDRLANGVYLYRVIAYDSMGNAYEHHDTGTDGFFKNKIGKIVILR